MALAKNKIDCISFRKISRKKQNFLFYFVHNIMGRVRMTTSEKIYYIIRIDGYNFVDATVAQVCISADILIKKLESGSKGEDRSSIHSINSIVKNSKRKIYLSSSLSLSFLSSQPIPSPSTKDNPNEIADTLKTDPIFLRFIKRRKKRSPFPFFLFLK